MDAESDLGKSQFEEQEKVLCYEPDSDKKMLLYDSKILKVEQEIDEQGRKFWKYLIHFQGWSHSWNQYVTEDMLLKDTKENRNLKKTLAEEAKLSPGGNLYRKEGEMSSKLVPRSAGIKPVENQVEDPGEMSKKLVLRSAGKKLVENQVEDTSENVNLAKNQEDDVVEDDIEEIIKINDAIKLPVRELPKLDFPEILKHHTGYNCHLVQDKNVLVRLPSQPNVVTLLENFLRYIVRNDFRINKIIKNNNNQEPEILNENQLKNRLTICIQVLDGLRICFNTYLFNRLLVNDNEVLQYNKALKMTLQPPLNIIQQNDKPKNGQSEEELKNDDNCVGGKSDSIEISSDAEKHYKENEEKRRRSMRQYFKSLKIFSDGSLTKHQSSQIVKEIFAKVREKYIIKADEWKAVPDSVYHDEVKQPAIVYGVYHLLRLLEELPEILALTELQDEKLSIVYSYSNELLYYLSTQTHLFGPQYYL